MAIPFGTVVLEDLAFRGTLLGLLRGRLTTMQAVTGTSMRFGLWHIRGVAAGAGGAPPAIDWRTTT